MNRYKKVKTASILGIIGNIFLFIIKLIASIMSKSSSMLADTFNSSSDILSSFITYIGNKISSKPKDEDHDLGHGKAEYIFSLIISITMMILVYTMIKTSIKGIINKELLVYSNYLLFVCIVTIVIKFMLYLYTNKIAKEEKNLLIKASSKDHRNDMFVTMINLLSVVLGKYKIYYVDSVVALLISLWILITAIKIFKESYDVLMDKTISEEARKEVLNIIDKHPEIKKIQHFNATPIGYKYQISLTIFVDGNLSTFDSHKIADDLEKEIVKNIDEIYLAVIHVNPY